MLAAQGLTEKRSTIKRELQSFPTSNRTYVASELKPCDILGFHACGVFLWKFMDGTCYTLLAVESRKGKTKMNLIGGKREKMLGVLETPSQTMSREIEEETAGSVDCTIEDPVIWDHNCKQCIFISQVFNEPTIDRENALTLQWVPCGQLQHLLKANGLHYHTSLIVRILLSCATNTHAIPRELAGALYSAGV